LEEEVMQRVPTAVAILGSAIVAISLASSAGAQERIEIDGSSTVYPITEAMAEEFQIEKQGEVLITVGISGTGGGFKKFCRGEIDISDASRPIKESERQACKEAGIEFIELPVALDALTVMVNPNNDWVDHLTIEELKKIWEPAAQGTITNWSQVREGFPDRELNLYGPGVDSGTYDYFTEAVVGEEGASRGDFTASEDDNVLVQGIANDPNALGFFGLAYYEENLDKLKAMPISWQGSDPVAPSAEAAKSGTYQPLSRPIFIYVSRQSAEEKKGVAEFVHFYLDPEIAPALVREVGYVPLPDEAYELALENFENRHTGTAFAGGSKVGVAVEDLLAAQKTD
jgi:phosphate transport system substrate-binding protein